jgi:hypothetical protein
MDIVRFVELRIRHLIDVATPRGIVQFIPTRIFRGTGDQKYWLTIEGTIQQVADETETCSVSFNGREHQGRFLGVVNKAGFQILTFQALIPDPEFWREP